MNQMLMQWYAFHNEPPGVVDGSTGKKQRLLKIFEGRCDNVIDLLLATDENAILRRDIYDCAPTFNWGKGRVTLLGDSVHAIQPNLGQGGCMAIEDSYQLAMELDKAWERSIESGSPIDVISFLMSFEDARRLRVAVIHGLARMAAIMVSTYKAYLGVGLGYHIQEELEGDFFIDLAMPIMLSWVLDVSLSVSSSFHSAANSDIVWERFLPSDYEDIVSRLVTPLKFSSKKGIFVCLCDPILIDGGNK
ncbi:unnamed protein product [Camellia sinensis]